MDVRMHYSRGLEQLLHNEHFSLFILSNYFPHGATAPSGLGRPHYRSFTITLRHNSVGRIPLDE